MRRPERWQTLLTGLLILTLGGALGLLRSQLAQQDALRTAWRQQQALRAARWQSVVPLQAALSSLKISAAAARRPFSPVDFQRQDAELVSWKPDERGGELVLETAWGSIPSVFTLLAERGMQVTAFAIKAGARRHLLTLHLEDNDGD